MTTFPSDFLWGASTAPHQIEGNNVNSDWWAREAQMPGAERSGDACDSYHRYGEDIALLAGAGLNAYRFGVEWARIQPERGMTSRALLDHYRRMIASCSDNSVTPVVTLQHFTTPLWFAREGGWMADGALEDWSRYLEAVAGILDGVEWVCTINEPNMLALMITMSRLAEDPDQRKKWQSPTVEGGVRPVLPDPDPLVGERLIEAHTVAREILHARTTARVGWTVANQALVAMPGAEHVLKRLQAVREDMYLEPAARDDFIGVQSYSSQMVDENGIVPHPPHLDNTMVGTAFRPDALGMAVRHTWEKTEGTPILVTENGIATSDDERRITYTRGALEGLGAAMAKDIDVRGYLHWSLLDNYEWGHWAPTFGLVAVDQGSFRRTPKPSLGWLGDVARRGALERR